MRVSPNVCPTCGCVGNLAAAQIAADAELAALRKIADLVGRCGCCDGDDARTTPEMELLLAKLAACKEAGR